MNNLIWIKRKIIKTNKIKILRNNIKIIIILIIINWLINILIIKFFFFIYWRSINIYWSIVPWRKKTESRTRSSKAATRSSRPCGPGVPSISSTSTRARSTRRLGISPRKPGTRASSLSSATGASWIS